MGDIERGHEAQEIRTRRIQEQALASPAGIPVQPVSGVADDLPGDLRPEVERAQQAQAVPPCSPWSKTDTASLAHRTASGTPAPIPLPSVMTSGASASS